ncbi:MAG: quercetin 2,3-dioxygenase [Gemmatimonadaceae bacterium]|nr:quercetin 2,3-dioxygenase [Gemmatimonadaceae bacterium]
MDRAEAYLCKPGESEVRWMGDTSTHFLATGALTGEEFGLVEESVKRGASVPLHRHDRDIESFYVIEGRITFYLGDQPGALAVPGTFVHIPGGTIHGFRVESDTARYLILTTPRHAEFYRAITVSSPMTPIEDSVIGKACQE